MQMSQSSPSPEKLAGGEKKASRRKKRGKSFILAFDFSTLLEQSSLLTASELRVKIYTSVERAYLGKWKTNKWVLLSINMKTIICEQLYSLNRLVPLRSEVRVKKLKSC